MSEELADIVDGDPVIADQLAANRRRYDGAEFREVAGFDASSDVYDLLVPPDERVLVQSPRQAAELVESDADIDVVVHMGCHVVKTPHIITATLDILDELGYSAVPLGGFNNCCGVQHFKIGDLEGAEQVDSNRFENAAAFDPDYFITECTSCYATTATLSLRHRDPDFAVSSMVDFLLDRKAEVLDHVSRTDPVRIAIHDHYDSRGWTPDSQKHHVRELFSALPGVEIVEMEHSLDEGLPCNYRTDLDESAFDDNSRRIYEEADAVGADVLVDFWHACHRHLVSYDREFDVTAKNYTAFIAERLGYEYRDTVKEYKNAAFAGDIEGIIDDARPVFEANGVDEARACEIAKSAFTESMASRAQY